jgi:hypothetical protein
VDDVAELDCVADPASLSAAEVVDPPDFGASDPASVFGSTLFPVFTSTSESVGFLPGDVSAVFVG